MRSLTILTMLGALLLSACGDDAPTPTPSPTPTPPYGLAPLSLPADESPHDFQTEWWYFNAHLTDNTGGRFALHDVIFQVQQLTSGRSLYVRQVGLADAQAMSHSTAERLRATDQPLTAASGDFEIVIGDGSMSGSQGERYRLVGGTSAAAYDLTLVALDPTLVHDDDGLVDFGEAGVTYYYSRPRLEVTGTITTDEGTRAVSGLAWLDKQWGDFQPVAVYWDWASVQFDDGTDLMLTRLMDTDRHPIDIYATLGRPGKQNVRLGADEFTFEPVAGASWHSEETDTTYATRWRVAVPSAGIAATLEPLVTDSEFSSGFLGVVYWEAGVDVVDSSGARIGQGFVELNWARNIIFD